MDRRDLLIAFLYHGMKPMLAGLSFRLHSKTDSFFQNKTLHAVCKRRRFFDSKLNFAPNAVSTNGQLQSSIALRLLNRAWSYSDRMWQAQYGVQSRSPP